MRITPSSSGKCSPGYPQCRETGRTTETGLLLLVYSRRIMVLQAVVFRQGFLPFGQLPWGIEFGCCEKRFWDKHIFHDGMSRIRLFRHSVGIYRLVTIDRINFGRSDSDYNEWTATMCHLDKRMAFETGTPMVVYKISACSRRCPGLRSRKWAMARYFAVSILIPIKHGWG